jgi:hypothetical protein
LLPGLLLLWIALLGLLGLLGLHLLVLGLHLLVLGLHLLVLREDWLVRHSCHCTWTSTFHSRLVLRWTIQALHVALFKMLIAKH